MAFHLRSMSALPRAPQKRTLPPWLSSFGQAGCRAYISWRAISSGAHELEGFDYLFAILMLVNLARGPVGKFVLVMRWNRIAEHQRVNDPDCGRLHCQTPTPDRPSHTPCQLSVADQTHRANSSRSENLGWRAQTWEREGPKFVVRIETATAPWQELPDR